MIVTLIWIASLQWRTATAATTFVFVILDLTRATTGRSATGGEWVIIRAILTAIASTPSIAPYVTEAHARVFSVTMVTTTGQCV